MKKCELAGGLQHFCAFSPLTVIVEVTNTYEVWDDLPGK